MEVQFLNQKIKKILPNKLSSNLSTCQSDNIKNYHLNNFKKQKLSKRFITEHSEKGHSTTSQKKNVVKHQKFPFTSSSPQLKKNILQDHSSSTKKLIFGNSISMNKKKILVNKPNFQKIYTEPGGMIKKKKINLFEKKIFFAKEQKKNILKDVQKKQLFKKKDNQNVFDKKIKPTFNKIKDSKIQLNLEQCSKLRLKTEGTFDSTPYFFQTNDIQILSLIGQGTFGKVYKGRIIKTGDFVAIKKVFQDPKYKNRQIQIVSMLKSQYVMKVIGTFKTIQNGNQYLSIIMDYYQCDLFNYIKNNGKKGLNTFQIKIITYQIFRGLNYIHSLNICHRDIKPHNILIQGKKTVICDFGSAKIITSEPNLPYICSRCYRAPQLIFGATHYNTMIDIWSTGCVILEMIQGKPLFVGQSSIDHLIEIIKVMGTPTKTQVVDMNPQYDLNDYKFPKIKKKHWSKIYPNIDESLIDLISKIMIYSPNQRLNAAQALCHPFYDQLRDQKIQKQIQNQFKIDLFSFTQDQLRGMQHLFANLIPKWMNQ